MIAADAAVTPRARHPVGPTWIAAAAALVACGSPPSPVDLARAAPSTSETPTVPVPRPESALVLPEGRIAARSVVIADGSTCALLVDGSVWCWGSFYQHESTRDPLVEIPLPPVKSLAAFDRRTYALTPTGDVYEWGFDAERRELRAPIALDVHGVKAVTGAGDRTCFVFESGEATCAGAAGGPAISRPSGTTAATARGFETCFATADAVTCVGPARSTVRPLPDVVALAASTDRTCALTKAGHVGCWSWEEPAAFDLFGDRTFVSLEGNDSGVCARGSRGAPVCLRNAAAELAASTQRDGEASSFASPSDALQSRRGVTGAALAPTGGCFVEAGLVWCWGDSAPAVRREPGVVDLGDLTSLRSARGIAVGREHTCVVGMDDLVRCWGGNFFGALGVGDGFDRLGPERWRDVGPVEKIAANEFYTCAITKASKDDDGGRLVCAGAPATRYLSSSCVTAVPSPCTPTPTLVSTRVADVAIGQDFACLLDTDGGVRCWGNNDRGQLGAGDTTPSDTPRAVVDASGAPLTRVMKLRTGAFHTCAIVAPPGSEAFRPGTTSAAAGGDVVCWGYDDPGVQGRRVSEVGKENVGAMRLAATPVPMPAKVVDVGERCAILEGGEARCWGRLPNADFSLVPMRVGACGIKATRSGCLLGPEGIACIDDPTAGGEPVPAWKGPAIDAWDVNKQVSCVVTADHHAACRSRWLGLPRFGGGGPGLAEFAPTPGCPEDPPAGAAPPIALYAGATVMGEGGLRNLTADEVKTIASEWSGPIATSCEGEEKLWFEFRDALDHTSMRFAYVAPPCEGLRDANGAQVARRLSPAGKKMVQGMVSALSAERMRMRPE